MTVHNPAEVGQRSRQAAARVKNHRGTEAVARLGFASRGLVYVLIGVLAVLVATGASGERTDRGGALRRIADVPFGRAVLVALVIGFFGYALWRALEAAVGHTDETDRKKRAAKRVGSGVRAAIYAAIAVSTLVFLASDGRSGGSDDPAPYTARIMAHTGGRWLVGAIGLAVVAVGVAMVVRGLTASFEKKLRTASMSGRARRAAKHLGQVGYLARGVVFGLAGVLVTKAAATFDPNEAEGFDGTLKKISEQVYGQWLLAVCGVGLAVFGLYSFLEARYRKI